MILNRSGEAPQSFRDVAGDILASWRVELLQLALPLWKNLTFDRKATLALEFGDAVVVATQILDGRATDTVEIERASGDHRMLSGRLAQLSDLQSASKDIALRLPANAALNCHVQMPNASRRNLVQALRYELSRLSPLEPEQLYFDFVVRPAPTDGKMRNVALRIVKRSLVDEAAGICSDAGLRIASIGFTGDPRDADFRQFPVNKIALLRTLWRRWNVPLLGGFALLLAGLLLVAAYLRHIEAGHALSRELDTAQGRAVFVEYLQRKAQTALAESAFLIRQKQAPMLTGMLADLSRILPDDTSISDLTMDGDKLRLAGTSRSAADLIALLDRSGMFANAQFTAPLTQESRTGSERFDLSVEVRRRAP